MKLLKKSLVGIISMARISTKYIKIMRWAKWKKLFYHLYTILIEYAHILISTINWLQSILSIISQLAWKTAINVIKLYYIYD